MKTGRGWWALAVGVLPFVLYAGASYEAVWKLPKIPGAVPVTETIDVYGPGSWWGFHIDTTRRLFWPINQIDRRVRTRYWEPPPD